MASVSGPLMSLDASGTVAGAIVFSKWKGRAYVRRHAIPANPQTGLQVSVRSMMRFLSQIYASAVIDDATWLLTAASLRISPFNAFTRENLIRWRQYRTPTSEYPAAEIAVAPAAPTTTVSGGVHSLSLSILPGAQIPDMGWVIHRSTQTGFTPSLSNVVAVIPYLGSPQVYVDHPLAVGLKYYRIKGFMSDGKAGSMEAEKSGTVT